MAEDVAGAASVPVPGRLAVMDIGSNTARVEVVEERDGRLVTITGKRAALRLMRAIGRGGRIDAATEQRILDTVAEFAAIARSAGAERTVAVATSAIRGSANGAEVVRRIGAATGVDFRIIDGRTEARCVATGVMQDTDERNAVVLDIGGGSLELARVRDGVITETRIYPLGSLYLSDTFLHGDPPTLNEVLDLVSHVAAGLAADPFPPLAPGERLLVTGGTLRNAVSIAGGGATDPTGKTLSGVNLARLATALGSVNAAERGRMKGLSAHRVDSILGGVVTAIVVMNRLGADTCTVSGNGLRHGVAATLLAGHALENPSTPGHTRELA